MCELALHGAMSLSARVSKSFASRLQSMSDRMFAGTSTEQGNLEVGYSVIVYFISLFDCVSISLCGVRIELLRVWFHTQWKMVVMGEGFGGLSFSVHVAT